MTEERKYAILFATTLLCARKIIDLIDTNASERMGKKFWLGEFEREALDQVFQIMSRIDERWPEETGTSPPADRDAV
jgi:hypothetical protein